jgi:hypothetical protein
VCMNAVYTQAQWLWLRMAVASWLVAFVSWLVLFLYLECLYGWALSFKRRVWLGRVGVWLSVNAAGRRKRGRNECVVSDACWCSGLRARVSTPAGFHAVAFSAYALKVVVAGEEGPIVSERYDVVYLRARSCAADFHRVFAQRVAHDNSWLDFALPYALVVVGMFHLSSALAVLLGNVAPCSVSSHCADVATGIVSAQKTLWLSPHNASGSVGHRVDASILAAIARAEH